MAAPRADHRVDLDQLTTPIQFHRARVHAGIQPPPDQVPGNAVERLGDLHMPTRGHLGMGPGRDVEHVVGQWLSWGASSVANTSAGRSRVLPCTRVPGHPLAPLLGSRPTLVKIPKVFSDKEIRSHIGDTTLDPSQGLA